MVSPKDLLFIEPKLAASAAPLIDDLTRRMAAAHRVAERSPYCFAGVHRCVCGALSKSFDLILPNGEKTNSLCVHYLAHHRQEVPSDQLARVAGLNYGEADPSEVELRGTGHDDNSTQGWSITVLLARKPGERS